MNITDCSHRRNTCELQVRDRTLVLSRCQLLTDELGFVNSVFDEQCRECLAGRTTPPQTITHTEMLMFLARRHLRARIHCHDDPRFPTYRNAPILQCIAKMQALGMTNEEIGACILEAVAEHGMPAQRAAELASDLGL